LIHGNSVTGGDRKTAFFLQISPKMHTALSISQCVMCSAIFYHYKPAGCNVGVTFLAFFGDFDKKMHAALSISHILLHMRYSVKDCEGL
jgi:hypothetical protein